MKRLPMEKKKQNFYERMTYEIDRLENLDINDADLVSLSATLIFI